MGTINKEDTIMKVTVSLDDLLKPLLGLSADNQRWLADKLIERADEQEKEETISKEEILAGIDQGLKEIRLTREGKIKPKTAKEFLHEL